jgi:hypothetical protein
MDEENLEPQDDAAALPEPAAVEEPTPRQPDPALARLEAQIRSTQEHLDSLRSAVVNRQPTPSTPPPVANPTKEELERQFWKDPLGSVAAIAGHVAGQVAQATRQQDSGSRETLIEVARQQARAVNPELFDQYFPEILALVQTMPVEARTNVNVWHNSRDVVFGRHIGDISVKKPTPVSSTDGLTPPSPRPPAAPPKPKLNEQEAIMAKKLGLSEDQYLAGKEAYADQANKWPLTFRGSATGSRRAAAK